MTSIVKKPHIFFYFPGGGGGSGAPVPPLDPRMDMTLQIKSRSNPHSPVRKCGSLEILKHVAYCRKSSRNIVPAVETEVANTTQEIWGTLKQGCCR